MPIKGSGVGRRKGGPQLVVRLSELERDEIQARATKAGLARSEYVRRAALKGWKPPSVSQPTE